MGTTEEQLHELTISLAAGETQRLAIVGEAIYFDVAPDAASELFIMFDDVGPFMSVARGLWLRVGLFHSITVRNSSTAPITAHAVVSRARDFFAVQPGQGQDDLPESVRDWGFRQYAYASLPQAVVSTVGTGATFGFPPGIDLLSGVGANRQHARAENNVTSLLFRGPPNPLVYGWGFRHRVQSTMFVSLFVNPTATQGCGIMLDCPSNGSSEWLSTASPPALTNIQLYVRASDLRFYLRSAVENVGVTEVMLSNPALTYPSFDDVRILEFDFMPGQYVKGYVDGVLGATITGANVPTHAASPLGFTLGAAGVFISSGTNVNANVTATFTRTNAYTRMLDS